METTSKTCTRCLACLPIEKFGRQASAPDGYKYQCKNCDKQYMAAYRSANREKMRGYEAARIQRMSEEERARKRELDNRRYHSAPEVARDKILRKKYGITQADYDAMLEQQGGVCAICQNPNERRILAVDHHHGTGAVRGLLCDSCNNGLGRFRDDPNYLARAIAYLLNT